uniref:Uncharacterized protein n=1 Tax=Noctiluca scintillans TaxID=2966 RepID=A0A7S0ZQ85_NOCSC
MVTYGSVSGDSNHQDYLHAFLRSGSLHAGANPPNIWELIFIPWICLAIILACVTCASFSILAVLWVPFAVLVVVACLFVYAGWKKHRHGSMILGILIIIACGMALFVGLIGWCSYLYDYRRIGHGATYSNVSPYELAAAHSDATAINFMNGTTVDTSMTYGYLDGLEASDKMYCVAPVSFGGQNESTVQYFAVGTDCCQSRSSFDCGATGENATGGITLAGVPWSYPAGYESAVSGAEYTYDLTVGDQYLLLTWVDDAEEYRTKLLHKGLLLFFVFAGVYMLLSCVSGLLLHRMFTYKG